MAATETAAPNAQKIAAGAGSATQAVRHFLAGTELQSLAAQQQCGGIEESVDYSGKLKSLFIKP